MATNELAIVVDKELETRLPQPEQFNKRQYEDYLLSKSCSAHLRNKLMAAICKNTKSADAEVKQIVSHVMITLQSLTSGVMTTEEKSKRQSMIDSNAKALFDRMPNPYKMREAFEEAAGSPNKWPLLIAAGCGYKKSFLKVWDKLKDNQEKRLETDLLGYNCLVRAIKSKQREIVKVILKMDDTKAVMDLMKMCLEKKKTIFGYTYETPLRMLIKHMPDMAKLFLDLCDAETVNKVQQPTHQQITKEDCIDYYPGRNVKTNDDKWAFIDDDEWALNNSSQTDSSMENSPESWKATCAYSVCTNKVKKWLQKEKQEPGNHVLNYIDANHRLTLMKHPFISRRIDHKWKAAKLIYILLFILYTSFIFFLTAYSFITPNPVLSSTCNNATLGLDGNMSSTSDKNSFNLNHPNSPIDTNCSFRLWAAIIVIFFAALHIALEILQVLTNGASYFFTLENYVQIFIFIGSIVYTSNFERQCNCIDESRWQLGAFVLFCAWINFILLLKDNPTFGTPIKLLFNICLKYIKLVYLPILLMISFALPFYMVFVINVNGMALKFQNSINRFSKPSWSLLSYWVGQTGDTGFSDVFLGAPLPYIPTAAILFVIFLILVPVLFNNMLIGLAVGDVSAAYEEAELNNLASQINFILFVEDIVPASFMKMLMCITSRCCCYCRCCDNLQNFLHNFFTHLDTKEKVDTVEKEDLLAIADNLMEEMDDVKQQLATMKQTMEQLATMKQTMEQLATMKQTMEQLATMKQTMEQLRTILIKKPKQETIV